MAEKNKSNVSVSSGRGVNQIKSSEDLDLINRDPHKMNHFIQVEFDDVLAEPSGTHSKDCVWKNSYKCFTCGKNNAYSILTLLCGIISALSWGCTFGCLAFEIIWCITPCVRLLNVLLHPIKKIFSIILISNL